MTKHHAGYLGINEDDAQRSSIAACCRPCRVVAELWCGKLSVCPNEMVPLQIDLAIGFGRYLLG